MYPCVWRKVIVSFLCGVFIEFVWFIKRASLDVEWTEETKNKKQKTLNDDRDGGKDSQHPDKNNGSDKFVFIMNLYENGVNKNRIQIQ